MTSRHAVTVGITAARAQTSVYMNIDACVVDIRWPVSPRCWTMARTLAVYSRKNTGPSTLPCGTLQRQRTDLRRRGLPGSCLWWKTGSMTRLYRRYKRHVNMI